MASIQDHLSEIAKLDGKPEALATARQRLIDEYENDPIAADAVTEAMYRQGLYTLMNKKDLAAAMDIFKKAAERKNASWSPIARTSYALTLQAKGKHQQAVFELRKVIGTGSPTPASATALVCLATILRDAKAKPSEIEKADKERITALTQLANQAPPKTSEAAHWRYLLAIAHKEGGSRTECKKQLEQVVAMGDAAGKETLAAAKDALKGM